MALVWLCEMTRDDSREFLAGFNDEITALKEAAYLIIDEFTNDINWDMSVAIIASTAFDIHNNIKIGRVDTLRRAIIDFSKFSKSKFGNNGKEITVIYTVVYTKPDSFLPLDDSFFNQDEDDEEEEELSEEEIKADVEQAAAATGATCLNCKVFNEYAAPTTADNMYCCTQCKTFIKVFSQEN